MSLLTISCFTTYLGFCVTVCLSGSVRTATIGDLKQERPATQAVVNMTAVTNQGNGLLNAL